MPGVRPVVQMSQSDELSQQSQMGTLSDLTPVQHKVLEFAMVQLKLKPQQATLDARLLHDLGLTGHRAKIFIRAFSHEFNVNCDALLLDREEWNRHFGQERFPAPADLPVGCAARDGHDPGRSVGCPMALAGRRSRNLARSLQGLADGQRTLGHAAHHDSGSGRRRRRRRVGQETPIGRVSASSQRSLALNQARASRAARPRPLRWLPAPSPAPSRHLVK